MNLNTFSMHEILVKAVSHTANFLPPAQASGPFHKELEPQFNTVPKSSASRGKIIGKKCFFPTALERFLWNVLKQSLRDAEVREAVAERRTSSVIHKTVKESLQNIESQQKTEEDILHIVLYIEKTPQKNTVNISEHKLQCFNFSSDREIITTRHVSDMLTAHVMTFLFIAIFDWRACLRFSVLLYSSFQLIYLWLIVFDQTMLQELQRPRWSNSNPSIPSWSLLTLLLDDNRCFLFHYSFDWLIDAQNFEEKHDHLKRDARKIFVESMERGMAIPFNVIDDKVWTVFHKRNVVGNISQITDKKKTNSHRRKTQRMWNEKLYTTKKTTKRNIERKW